VLEEMMKLEYHTDLASERAQRRRRSPGTAVDGQVLYLHGSQLKRFQAGDHAQDGGLAGAGRTHQRHQLAARNVEGDVRQHTALATAKAQGLDGKHPVAHAVALFQCRSRRRASAASGSDIAR
jgi:hypothetical protein